MAAKKKKPRTPKANTAPSATAPRTFFMVHSLDPDVRFSAQAFAEDIGTGPLRFTVRNWTDADSALYSRDELEVTDSFEDARNARLQYLNSLRATLNAEIARVEALTPDSIAVCPDPITLTDDPQ